MSLTQMDCAAFASKLSESGVSFLTRSNVHGFRLAYRPPELIACTEFGPITRLNDVDLRERISELGATQLYLLELPNSFLSQHSEADQLRSYLRSELKSDIKMILDQDTIPCSFAHLEAGPAVGPFKTMLVGFDRPTTNADRVILWENKEGFFSSSVVFRFAANSFDKYAKLVSTNAQYGS